MDKGKNYKVGDKLVEFGRVFRIFKIKKQKNSDGQIEKIIYFRPYYKNKESDKMICSIPLNSLDKTRIRKTASKKEFGHLIRKLKKKNVEKLPSIDIAKQLLKSNNPTDTVKVIRKLWYEKNETLDNLSKSKKDIFNLAMNRLVQEYASVSGLSLEKARKRIKLSLQE